MVDETTTAFEGPEKLLEIWFYPQKTEVPHSERSLRSIGHEKWKELLNLVKCEILSTFSTNDIDCFLLSESSMFVFDHKLMLKTCGTTTTLLCLPKLFELIKKELEWDFHCHDEISGEIKNHPYKVFYSRRAFMFPENQSSIHRNWDAEVDYLNQFFVKGKSYVIGRVDQNDHWNLYVTQTNEDLRSGPDNAQEDDFTLEILMTDLSRSQAKQFVTNEPDHVDGHIIGTKMTNKAAIDKIYKFDHDKTSFKQDSFGFQPCGYSCNMAVNDSYYYTIHVTPEEDWSYASFESNVLLNKINADFTQLDVINNVLKVFQPLDFCLTMFIKTESAECIDAEFPYNKVLNYSKQDRIVHDLDDYQLIYIKYSKI
ncbi:unnamed protein product [Kluyveromyces dobzhanskii CBS 2104]|uniref:S-adenosylmethionine decarboxylase proenzyme n=1 Tax=Kluyveromyces dobzhanskii CBS 2104 TaxID=1427455 RepID=A0A0A8L2A9_9SACH|nr:unnamed protein product [Kluyveromyces dobzhanskii CBS 2104]